MHRVKSPCPGALDFMPPAESFKKKPKYIQCQVGCILIWSSCYLCGQSTVSSFMIDSDITKRDVQKNQMQVAKRREALNQMGGPGHPLYTRFLCSV